MTPDEKEKFTKMEQSVEEIKSDISEIKSALIGNILSGDRGLIGQVTLLKQELEFVRKDLDVVQKENVRITLIMKQLGFVTGVLVTGFITAIIKLIFFFFVYIEETKFYLKTDRFNIEYSKVMIKDGIEYNKDFIEYMMQVKFLVEVAKSHAMLGDFVKAQRFFEDAKKKLRKYVECKNCT